VILDSFACKYGREKIINIAGFGEDKKN